MVARRYRATYGFRRARFTRVNNVLSFVLAVVIAVAFYGALIPFQGTFFATMLTERGPTQYFTVLFSAWSLVILIIKSRKLAMQRRALAFQVVPAGHDFVLSSTTVDDVIHQIYATVDDPKRFVLFNRIVIALSNLRNWAKSPRLADILRSQADQDEAVMETSYSLIQGFVWAIPVLGFIGTVLGLSEAISSFSRRSRHNCRHDANRYSSTRRNCWAGHCLRNHLSRPCGSVIHSTLADRTAKGRRRVSGRLRRVLSS